jgi:hypothetical protein
MRRPWPTGGSSAKKKKKKKRRIMDVYMNNQNAGLCYSNTGFYISFKINVLFQKRRLLKGKVFILLIKNVMPDD